MKSNASLLSKKYQNATEENLEHLISTNKQLMVLNILKSVCQ